MQFIGIDFGTTNSLAGVINSGGKLQLIPLEGENPEMPSAVFLKVNHEPPLEISLNSFELRVKRALDKDRDRFNQELADVERRLTDFINLNKPRAIKPKASYSYSRAYEKAVERYLRDRDGLPLALKFFNETEVAKERIRLEMQVRGVLSDEETRRQVRSKMEEELIEAELEALGSQTFFTALNSDDALQYFGEQAKSEYLKAPLNGFFMGSPKAFLAVQLTGAQQELFVRIVTLVLSEIKKRSENFLGFNVDGVVLGRPVNYMGAEHGGGNHQALNIMRKAAISAGFNEVRFVIEPMAAALVISKTMFDSNVPALVVDVGGGTTDVVYFDVDSSADVKLSVLSTSGERVGGGDFDEAIAISKFGPLIGTQSRLINGSSAPNGVIVDALSTRDIHRQAKFRRSGGEIHKLITAAEEPVIFQRLYRIWQEQLQHRLLLNAEELKKCIGAKPTNTLELILQNESFDLALSASELESICESEIKRIERIVSSALEVRDVARVSTRVFLTGGMSLCPAVVEAIHRIFPEGTIIRRISSLQSVVAGLAVAARHLSLTENFLSDNENVRGIPISK